MRHGGYSTFFFIYGIFWYAHNSLCAQLKVDYEQKLLQVQHSEKSVAKDDLLRLKKLLLDHTNLPTALIRLIQKYCLLYQPCYQVSKIVEFCHRVPAVFDDKNNFIAVNDGRHLVLGNANTGRCATAKLPFGNASAIAISPDNTTLALGVEECVHLYDLATLTATKVFSSDTPKGERGIIKSIVYSRDCTQIAAVDSCFNNLMCIWNLNNSKPLKKFKVDYSGGLLGLGTDILAAYVHADHSIVITRTWSSSTFMNIWRAYNNAVPMYQLKSGNDDSIVEAVLSNDARWLLTAAGLVHARVQLWDMQTRNSKDSVVWDKGPISALALHPHAQVMVAGAYRSTEVRLWDVAGGESLQSLKCSSTPRTLLFNPHGDKLLVAECAGILRIFD